MILRYLETQSWDNQTCLIFAFIRIMLPTTFSLHERKSRDRDTRSKLIAPKHAQAKQWQLESTHDGITRNMHVRQSHYVNQFFFLALISAVIETI